MVTQSEEVTQSLVTWKLVSESPDANRDELVKKVHCITQKGLVWMPQFTSGTQLGKPSVTIKAVINDSIILDIETVEEQIK